MKVRIARIIRTLKRVDRIFNKMLRIVIRMVKIVTMIIRIGNRIVKGSQQDSLDNPQDSHLDCQKVPRMVRIVWMCGWSRLWIVIEINGIIIMIVLLVNRIVRIVTRKVEFVEYGHLEYRMNENDEIK